MVEHALPALYAVLVWWSATGAIVYLDGLPRWTFKWSMLTATALLGASMVAIALTRDSTTVTGAYIAFTGGLLAWGWQEMAFYTGLITGPRKTPCAHGCSGPRHLWHALETLLWHELAIVAGAVAIALFTWDGTNQIALWTYVVLWLMQSSAKVNVYLGVRNLNEQFLPSHLAHLTRYFTRRPMNGFFPAAVAISTAVWIWLITIAGAAETLPHEAAGYTFLATMLGLAILEHWFLVLPIPAEKLWEWSLVSHAASAPPGGTAPAPQGPAPITVPNDPMLSCSRRKAR